MHTFQVKLASYCWMAYRTGSPMCSDFTRIMRTTCDRNKLAYCLHSRAYNFAENLIEKNESTIPNSNKCAFWWCSVSTKCGEWGGGLCWEGHYTV